MILIRPVQPSDLDALVSLASTAGYGLTTLPHDPDLLRKRIAKSQRSFRDMTDFPAGEAFLFVAEDLESHHVIGTSGIVSKVGGFQPFYAYRLETSVHESKILGVQKEIPTLHLVAEHNGPSEICSLFLAPAERHSGAGRLLSLARFLFMAEHPASFDPTVVAELRGVIDHAGHSPFWDALGHYFFEVELPRADYLSMVDKRFIADLMPRHPIYVPLLPEAAQRVIGEVHEQTRPARALLESEGFRFAKMVDIFDAGPVLSATLQEIRTVRESRTGTVGAMRAGSVPEATPPRGMWVVCASAPEFRACLDTIDIADNGSIVVSAGCAEALRVKPGERIRFAPLRSPTPALEHGGEGI